LPQKSLKIRITLGKLKRKSGKSDKSQRIKSLEIGDIDTVLEYYQKLNASSINNIKELE